MTKGSPANVGTNSNLSNRGVLLGLLVLGDKDETEEKTSPLHSAGVLPSVLPSSLNTVNAGVYGLTRAIFVFPVGPN